MFCFITIIAAVVDVITCKMPGDAEGVCTSQLITRGHLSIFVGCDYETEAIAWFTVSVSHILEGQEVALSENGSDFHASISTGKVGF